MTKRTLTEQEQEEILELFGALRRSAIQDFMREHGVPGLTAKKKELSAAVKGAIEQGDLTYGDVLAHVDMHAPWGKQHLYLYRGPVAEARKFRDVEGVTNLLTKHGKQRLLNGSDLVLPAKLTLTAVDASSERFVVTAVQQRTYRERLESEDYVKVDDLGRRIEFRAHLALRARLLVRFEWHLKANTAMLQITQLPSGTDYDKVFAEFSKLVKPWLELDRFSPLDLRRAIKSLQRRHQRGDVEVRIQMADYKDDQGRRLAGYSPHADADLMGPGFVDRAMRQACRHGISHHGNFYWAPADDYPNGGGNPLEQEVHVHLLAAENRVNLTRPHPEEVIRYVLGRIRAACA